MKKLQQTLVVGALLIAPFAISQPASAATCEVGFTGPNSDNLCVSEATYTCKINSDNYITVVNNNKQTVASGSATVGGNGDGGSAQSGSVTNENGVTFDFSITNPGEGEEGSVCRILAATVPSTPEAPVVEPPKETVPAPEKKAAPVLARTAADSTVAIVATVLGVAVASLTVGKLAAAVIARRK